MDDNRRVDVGMCHMQVNGCRVGVGLHTLQRTNKRSHPPGSCGGDSAAGCAGSPARSAPAPLSGLSRSRVCPLVRWTSPGRRVALTRTSPRRCLLCFSATRPGTLPCCPMTRLPASQTRYVMMTPMRPTLHGSSKMCQNGSRGSCQKPDAWVFFS